MKKYILKNTNEEVNFGDIIELLLIKDNPDGTKKHKVKTVKFSEELIPLLLEEGVLDVQDDDKEDNKEDLKKNMIDFSNDDAHEEEEKEDKGSDDDIDDDVDEEEVGNFMEALTDLLETLGKSVKDLEKQVAYLRGKVDVLEKKDMKLTCKCPKSCTFGSDFDEDKSVLEFMKGFGVII